MKARSLKKRPEGRIQHLRRFVKELATDYDNTTYDTGRVAAIFAVLAMTALSGWDVIINHAQFRAQDLGFGIGAVLGAIGLYLMADNRRPMPMPPYNPNPYQPYAPYSPYSPPVYSPNYPPVYYGNNNPNTMQSKTNDVPITKE
jgi:hypothetical protein